MEHSPLYPPSNCLLCDNKSFTLHTECKDYFLSKEKFNIFSCNQCGLLITHPAPELSKLPSYYASDRYISHSDKQTDVFGKTYHFIRKIAHKRKYRLIRKYSSSITLLDIGCATGEFLNFCASQGMLVKGVEPNEKARNFARSTYSLNVSDEPSLAGFEDNSLDIITMWHVLEHVPDINLRMKELFRLLKPGGYAFIALPNHTSYDAAYYKNYWAAWDVPRHLYHFNRKSMSILTKKHKFAMISVIPMRLDSFYVSLLSEKYKTGKPCYVNALFRGAVSNIKARWGSKDYSSLIYILQK